MRAFADIDVTEAARRVRVPDARRPPARRPLAAASPRAGCWRRLIPGSRFVSLEGDNHLMLGDDAAWPRFLAEVDRFLAAVD